MTTPTVFQTKSIQDFVQHVLEQHIAPTTLVVCSSKDDFLEAVRNETSQLRHEEGVGSNNVWTIPTLRLLSTSSTAKVVFCPAVSHLRAYLATYSAAIARREPEPLTALRCRGATPILAILSPIRLHRPTSSFSAQGLNRTLSVAVEAAHATASKLVIAECPMMIELALDPDELVHDNDDQHVGDPWEEQLSILNVTTKRLGDIAVGRTVKARTVAERWCTFETLSRSSEL